MRTAGWTLAAHSERAETVSHWEVLFGEAEREIWGGPLGTPGRAGAELVGQVRRLLHGSEREGAELTGTGIKRWAGEAA